MWGGGGGRARGTSVVFPICHLQYFFYSRADVEHLFEAIYVLNILVISAHSQNHYRVVVIL